MIYKMFDIRGTKRQQDLTVEAINRISFPLDLTLEGMRVKWGQTHCPIYWDNNMSTSTAGEFITDYMKRDGSRIKGSMRMRFNAKFYDYYGLDPYYLPPYPKRLGTVPDPNQWEDEDAAVDDPPGSTWQDRSNLYNMMTNAIVHEIGHFVDATYLTGAHRRRIYNAFHGELTKDIPPHGHAVLFRDPAPKNRPEDMTATLEDDKIVRPLYDESGDMIGTTYQGGNDLVPRWTRVPGAPIPGVPGRENGFMRTLITDFEDVTQWFQPYEDYSHVPPITKAAAYEYRVGESFAEAWKETYSDISGFYRPFIHKPNLPGLQQLIAKTLTPWMLELYPNDQAAGGTGGQQGETVEDLPPYIPPVAGGGGGSVPIHTYRWPLPPEPLPPTDPVGWQPLPSKGYPAGYYATLKEKRFHEAHEGYAPHGAIIFPSREAAVESGKVPCPQCQP